MNARRHNPTPLLYSSVVSAPGCAVTAIALHALEDHIEIVLRHDLHPTRLVQVARACSSFARVTLS